MSSTKAFDFLELEDYELVGWLFWVRLGSLWLMISFFGGMGFSLGVGWGWFLVGGLRVVLGGFVGFFLRGSVTRVGASSPLFWLLILALVFFCFLSKINN